MPRSWRLACWTLVFLGSLILLWKGILPATGNTSGDFANYYTASRLAADGISIEPAYTDFSWFQRQMDRYGIRGQVGGWIPHPPPTALVFLPLTPFDPVTVRNIWTLVNILLTLLNIWLLVRLTELELPAAALLFLTCGYGLLNCFLFGQIYLLLTASILGGLELARRGRPLAAGMVLGCLVPVKYFGGFFLLYFAWKRRWKLVSAGTASALAVTLGSMALMGWRVYETFLLQVLPRHLQGEIQDPYTVAFQSWNSLLHRLFLREATLNPNPLLESPLAFFFFKSLIFWVLAGLCLLVFLRMRFPSEEQQRLFHLGWIPVVLLLLSPGSATYHFLLLSLSAACFVRLAISGEELEEKLGTVTNFGEELGNKLGTVTEKLGTVTVLAGIFAAVNLPHFVWLTPWAEGVWTPLGYPRLWLLTAFAAFSVWAFRSRLQWRISRRRSTLAIAAILVLAQASLYDLAFRSRPDDGAQRLAIAGEEYRRHLGLIVQSPSLGSERLAFSYCTLLDNRYRIFTGEGRPWGLPEGSNYFRPSLAEDDSSLLVETVSEGRSRILISTGPGQAPRFAVEGEGASWYPDGSRFVFEQGGRLHLFELRNWGQSPLEATEGGYDAGFSADGEWVVYCRGGSPRKTRKDDERARNSELRRVRVDGSGVELLYRADGRLGTPRMSRDGRWVAFSLDDGVNQDIWLLNLADGRPLRLTSNPSIDRDPVWDEGRSRILFTSDRGRGLACTTLYWIPLPAAMKR